MLPLAVAGQSAFFSTGLTLHAETHLELIRKFLDLPISTERTPDQGMVVRFG